jgi:hypothetical protein
MKHDRRRQAPTERAIFHEVPMRIVGKRKHVPGDRDGLDALVLAFGGGAPKGVFRYRTHEEANRDQEQWISERVQRRTKMSAESPSSSKPST